MLRALDEGGEQAKLFCRKSREEPGRIQGVESGVKPNAISAKWINSPGRRSTIAQHNQQAASHKPICRPNEGWTHAASPIGSGEIACSPVLSSVSASAVQPSARAIIRSSRRGSNR